MVQEIPSLAEWRTLHARQRTSTWIVMGAAIVSPVLVVLKQTPLLGDAGNRLLFLCWLVVGAALSQMLWLRDVKLESPDGPLVCSPLLQSTLPRLFFRIALGCVLFMALIGTLLVAPLLLPGAAQHLFWWIVCGLLAQGLSILIFTGMALWSAVTLVSRHRAHADLGAGRFAQGLAQLDRFGKWGGLGVKELRARLLDGSDEAAAEAYLDDALSGPGPRAEQCSLLLLRVEQRYDRGELAEAEIAARLAVAAMPVAILVHRRLAELQLEGPHPGDALARLALARELADHTFGALAHERLLARAAFAWALAQTGQQSEARQALAGLSLPEGLMRAEVAWRWGRALAALGDHAQARALYAQGAQGAGRAARRCDREARA